MAKYDTLEEIFYKELDSSLDVLAQRSREQRGEWAGNYNGMAITYETKVTLPLGVISDIINSSINWSHTPEGHSYWENEHTQLRRYIQELSDKPETMTLWNKNDLDDIKETFAESVYATSSTLDEI